MGIAFHKNAESGENLKALTSNMKPQIHLTYMHTIQTSIRIPPPRLTCEQWVRAPLGLGVDSPLAVLQTLGHKCKRTPMQASCACCTKCFYPLLTITFVAARMSKRLRQHTWVFRSKFIRLPHQTPDPMPQQSCSSHDRSWSLEQGLTRYCEPVAFQLLLVHVCEKS